MNIKHFLAVFCGLLLTASGLAADKLAVSEPVAKGGVKAEDIDAFWGILETSIKSDEYKLISRAALKQMLTEIGLTTSSDLVNLNSAQKAKLGQLETVKYILVSELGKFGTRYNCTLRIIDASTGEIDTARTANLRVKDFDELADKIEAALQLLLSDNKKLNASAILPPLVRVADAPGYLPIDFNVHLENALINRGVNLQNLQSVKKILQRNNLDNLYELEPKMFVKVGKLLEVQTLLQATITRFELVGKKYYVEETGAKGIRWSGVLEGSIRVISAQTGRVLASMPFEERVLFRNLGYSRTKDWTVDDYGKYLIKTVIPGKIAPAMLKIPELTGR